MRVALISYEYPPETNGGIGAYARQAARMLAARGHDVEVFSGTPDGAGGSKERDGARLIRIACPDRRNFGEAVCAPFAERERTRPFDVVEAPDLYAEAAELSRRRPHLPLVLRLHTPSYLADRVDRSVITMADRLLVFSRFMAGSLVRMKSAKPALAWGWQHLAEKGHYRPEGDREFRVARQARRVAAPSRALREIVLKDWNLEPGKTDLLPYPYEPDPRLLEIPPAPGARTVAFHGRIAFYKGVHVLAAAIPRIRRAFPESRFVFAGRSGSSPVADRTPAAWWRGEIVRYRDTETWLRGRLASQGNAVSFSGYLEPERLPEHLAAADICVFPSLWDNFPNACLEAMAAGRAIVATSSGGMRDMLGEDEEAGLLVAPGRPRELAAAIVRLLGDPALRHRLAARAREIVLERYSPAAIGPLHEAVYAKSMAGARTEIALR